MSSTAARPAAAPATRPGHWNNAMALVGRNLRIYFRDRTAVFLSMLSPLILVLLYLLFLGSLQVANLSEDFPAAPVEVVQGFVDTWVFAGMVTITPFTTAFAAMGSFVDDKASGRFREFRVSPLRQIDLIVGYLGAGFVVAVLTTCVLLVVGVAFLASAGGVTFTALGLLSTFALVLLLSFTFSALGAFILTFVGSSSGYTAVSTIIGTVLGFLAGVYLPIGMLGRAVADGLNLLPFSPAAMLTRLPLASAPRDALVSTAPAGSDRAVAALDEMYGYTLYVGGWQLQPTVVVIALLVFALVFTLLGAWRIGRSVR